jgi:DNA-binding FadR family transcriptional regulator
MAEIATRRFTLVPNGQKMAEHLAHLIHGEIREANIAPGTVMGSEPDLIVRYGVSRAVFREAVRLLEHNQIADMRRGQGGGLVVTEPDSGSVTRSAAIYLDYQGIDIHQIFAARSTIELRIIELAVENIDEGGIGRLRQALDREAESIESIRARDDTEVFSYDAIVYEVHGILAQMSGNEALRLFDDVLAGLVPRFEIPELLHKPGLVTTSEEIHRDHVAIVEAVVHGDAGLARHRMSKHLDRVHWLNCNEAERASQGAYPAL